MGPGDHKRKGSVAYSSGLTASVPMRLALAVCTFVLLPLAGCSTPPPDSPPAFADVWAALSGTETASYDACDGFMSGYVSTYGARGLACTTNTRIPLRTLLARYSGSVYTSGPHSLDASGLSVDLLSDDFGHYDPEFVEWAVDNAIVGENDATVRALLAPVYRARFQQLARVYWSVYQNLASEGYPDRAPAGAPEAYAEYLASGVVPEMARTEYYPGFTMTVFSDRNEALARDIAGPGEWHFGAMYEANTAVGFWMRRRADGTQEAFRDGLERLLAAYDAEWLAAM